MEVKVFEKDAKETPVLRLRLRQCGTAVILEVVGDDGLQVSRGNLLSINANGSLGRSSNISTKLGLELDESRRLKV